MNYTKRVRLDRDDAAFLFLCVSFRLQYNTRSITGSGCMHDILYTKGKSEWFQVLSRQVFYSSGRWISRW